MIAAATLPRGRGAAPGCRSRSWAGGLGDPTQGVVSAYQSGARQPPVPSLARLVDAAGLDLDMRLAESPVVQPVGEPLGERVRRHRGELREVVGRYGLSDPRVFASVARGDDGPESDVDLLVELPAGLGVVILGRAQTELGRLLGTRVDDVLGAADAIHAHLGRGHLHDRPVFDAVRVRLIEVGEVSGTPEGLLAHESDLPWAQIAGMRDRLARRHFDTSHAILAASICDGCSSPGVTFRQP